MQIEIRNSGGDSCGLCGSHEIVTVKATGAPIARDFTERVELVCRARERAFLACCEADRREVQSRIDGLFERRAKWYRPFRRRWHRKLSEEAAVVGVQLRPIRERAPEPRKEVGT